MRKLFMPFLVGAIALAFLPAPTARAAVELPFLATFRGATTTVEFAPGPPGSRSTFGDRCSVPSSWVISFAGWGRSTHLGAFTWTSSHCTQAGATPFDPITITDGQLTFVAANGDLLNEAYGNGVVSVVDPPTMCIDTVVVLDGGTGRFTHASGSALERGCFSLLEPNLPAVSDLRITSSGTIAYDAHDRAG